MSAFFDASPLSDQGQPCDRDCRYAQAVRSDPSADEWLWCSHPANATRVVHPGRPCARYAPEVNRTGARFDDLLVQNR